MEPMGLAEALGADVWEREEFRGFPFWPEQLEG